MKSVSLAAACLFFLACQGNTQEKTTLKTSKDSLSYSIGVDIGKNLRAQGIEIDPKVLAHGVQDGVDSAMGLLNDSAQQNVMNEFRRDLTLKQHEKTRLMGEKNKKDGAAFLAANKTKPGVKTTASGLQYKVIKEGSGKHPTETQSVTVNYRGTLIDGTEFDSSYKRGQPATFSLNQVVKGWMEGITLMTPGSKYELYIPDDLAWGDRSPGPQIPPNSTVIFEVELLSVK